MYVYTIRYMMYLFYFLYVKLQGTTGSHNLSICTSTLHEYDKMRRIGQGCVI